MVPGADRHAARNSKLHLQYGWFARWRRRYRRNGVLMAESLRNPESREDSLADAERHARRSRVRQGLSDGTPSEGMEPAGVQLLYGVAL